MHAEIHLTGPGRGSIKLDGHEISHTVRSFTLGAGANDQTLLTLDLNLRDPGSLTGPVDAVVTEETAQTLIALGWTPPGPPVTTVPRWMVDGPAHACEAADRCTYDPSCPHQTKCDTLRKSDPGGPW